MRPTIDETMMQIAQTLSLRAACQLRQVGCVLTDERGRIVGTGYNGRAAGLVNCEGDQACETDCEGLHAELNALLHCDNPAYVLTAYVTTTPCWHCFKALLTTPCMTVVVPHGYLDQDQTRGLGLWTRAGRGYRRLSR